jgi:hypothetical protein
MRLLYNKPIRKETTEEFFPHKISLDEFRERMSDNVENFYKNMNTLNTLSGIHKDDKFMEEWCEQFLSWCEVEQE